MSVSGVPGISPKLCKVDFQPLESVVLNADVFVAFFMRKRARELFWGPGACGFDNNNNNNNNKFLVSLCCSSGIRYVAVNAPSPRLD